jgi:preprotein translocase subunit SecG
VIVTVLNVVCVAASLVLGVGILMHKSSGGGLSEMFGGAASDAGRSSAHAAKNLTRFTAAAAAVWFASVIALGLLNAGAAL